MKANVECFWLILKGRLFLSDSFLTFHRSILSILVSYFEINIHIDHLFLFFFFFFFVLIHLTFLSFDRFHNKCTYLCVLFKARLFIHKALRRWWWRTSQHNIIARVLNNNRMISLLHYFICILRFEIVS